METITMLKVVHRNNVEEQTDEITFDNYTMMTVESDEINDTYDYYPDFGI